MLIRRNCALVASLILCSACTAWVPLEIDGPAPAEMPDRVRVVLESGEHVSLDRPFLDGDSVIAGFGDDLEFRRISLAMVTKVEAGEAKSLARSAGETIGVIALTTAALVLLVMLGSGF